MHAKDCSFETPRLHVADWHVLTDGQGREPRLPRIVRELLTPNVTQPLPESWHGPYSAKRAVDWIRERDAEGIQLLAVSRQTSNVVGLVLLHQGSSTPPDSGELRLGYLVSESQWGRGFATELVRGVVNWVRVRGFRSIIAGVAKGNASSIRVLEKTGFSRTESESPGAPEIFYTFAL